MQFRSTVKASDIYHTIYPNNNTKNIIQGKCKICGKTGQKGVPSNQYPNYLFLYSGTCVCTCCQSLYTREIINGNQAHIYNAITNKYVIYSITEKQKILKYLNKNPLLFTISTNIQTNVHKWYSGIWLFNNEEFRAGSEIFYNILAIIKQFLKININLFTQKVPTQIYTRGISLYDDLTYIVQNKNTPEYKLVEFLYTPCIKSYVA